MTLCSQVQPVPRRFPAKDIRSWTPAQLRAKWVTRLQGYREEKEKLRAKGRSQDKIDRKIDDLQGKLDQLERS